jgi:hypothetical protein
METGVGVAPGIAFGDDSEGACRICFAAEKGRLEAALERLIRFLGNFPAMPADICLRREETVLEGSQRH